MDAGEQATGHGRPGGRRRAKAPGRRSREVKVSVTEEELARIRANAAATGWGLKAWIAVAALTPPNGQGAGALRVDERAAQLVEFMRAGRQLHGIAVNLNQITRALNVLAADGRAGSDQVAELIAAVGERLSAVQAAEARITAAVFAWRAGRPRP